MPSRQGTPEQRERNARNMRSQKDQQVPEYTEDEARAYMESMLWPDGPVCPHCGSIDAYKMAGTSNRPGLHRCRDCEKQFTVTVGTVMEDSHLALSKWVKAIHLMSASKKGISALQMQRQLGLGSYKTAWHLCHRIRLAMRCEPMAGSLKGDVQVDETYVGGKPRKGHGQPRPKRGRGTNKQPVLVLVETAGAARSLPLERVDGKTLKSSMESCIDPSATIVTDELPTYPAAVKNFADHATVCHKQEQYVNEDGRHTNTAESFFALLKRGHYGVFHQISKKHLHRYCDEFSFRWNGRKLRDSERRDAAVRQATGKRLRYKGPVNTQDDRQARGSGDDVTK